MGALGATAAEPGEVPDCHCSFLFSLFPLYFFFNCVSFFQHTPPSHTTRAVRPQQLSLWLSGAHSIRGAEPWGGGGSGCGAALLSAPLSFFSCC